MKYLLDGIVWLGILFPLFTGGFWIERNGNHYGLYSPNVGLGLFLILLLFWFVQNKKSLESVSNLSSLRFLSRCKKFWSNQMGANPLRTLVVTGIVFVGFYLTVSLRKHWTFSTHAFDTGYFTNGIWNLAFKGQYISSIKAGKNIFTEHQSPVFWLWAPLYRIFPYAETLLISQAVILAFGGGAAFFLGRQYLGEKSLAASFFPLVYWLNPAVLSANNFEFHPEIIILPAGLWTLCGIQSEKKLYQWLASFPFLLFWAGKESTGPLMVGIGLSFLLGACANKKIKWDGFLGGVLIVCGLASFYFCTQLIPKMFGETYAFAGTYRQLGNSLFEILLSPIFRPEVFWKTLFQADRFRFFWYMLFPLGLLPMLSWRHYPSFFVALFMLFLMGDSTRLYPRFHYGIESSVGLFWALPAGVRFLRDRTPLFKNEGLIVLLLFVCTFLAMRQNQLYHARTFTTSDHFVWVEKEMIPKVNPEASLSVPSSLTPHLANRPWISHVPDIRKQDEKLVDCIVIDPSMDISPLRVEAVPAWAVELSKLGFQEVFDCGGLKVYQNKGSEHSCFKTTPICF